MGCSATPVSFLFLRAEKGSASATYSSRSDLINTQQHSACKQDSAAHALEHNHVQTLVKGNQRKPCLLA